MTGIEHIIQERKEQVEKHGRTLQDDIKNNDKYQLSFGAARLTALDPYRFRVKGSALGVPEGWDLKLWDKMLSKPYKERLRIAGALLAAEIDRIQAIEK